MSTKLHIDRASSFPTTSFPATRVRSDQPRQVQQVAQAILSNIQPNDRYPMRAYERMVKQLLDCRTMEAFNYHISMMQVTGIQEFLMICRQDATTNHLTWFKQTLSAEKQQEIFTPEFTLRFIQGDSLDNPMIRALCGSRAFNKTVLLTPELINAIPSLDPFDSISQFVNRVDLPPDLIPLFLSKFSPDRKASLLIKHFLGYQGPLAFLNLRKLEVIFNECSKETLEAIYKAEGYPKTVYFHALRAGSQAYEFICRNAPPGCSLEEVSFSTDQSSVFGNQMYLNMAFVKDAIKLHPEQRPVFSRELQNYLQHAQPSEKEAKTLITFLLKFLPVDDQQLLDIIERYPSKNRIELFTDENPFYTKQASFALVNRLTFPLSSMLREVLPTIWNLKVAVPCLGNDQVNDKWTFSQLEEFKTRWKIDFDLSTLYSHTIDLFIQYFADPNQLSTTALALCKAFDTWAKKDGNWDSLLPIEEDSRTTLMRPRIVLYTMNQRLHLEVIFLPPEVLSFVADSGAALFSGPEQYILHKHSGIFERLWSNETSFSATPAIRGVSLEAVNRLISFVTVPFAFNNFEEAIQALTVGNMLQVEHLEKEALSWLSNYTKMLTEKSEWNTFLTSLKEGNIDQHPVWKKIVEAITFKAYDPSISLNVLSITEALEMPLLHKKASFEIRNNYSNSWPKKQFSAYEKV